MDMLIDLDIKSDPQPMSSSGTTPGLASGLEGLFSTPTPNPDFMNEQPQKKSNFQPMIGMIQPQQQMMMNPMMMSMQP